MRQNIYYAFPTPIITYKVGREFTEDELKIVREEKQQTGIGNSASTSLRILEKPAMANLKKFTEECLHDWYINVYAPKYPDMAKLQITQSWLNYTLPGETHHTHYHPNSIVSGCIYMSADYDSDCIKFINNSSRAWNIVEGESNAFNCTDFHIGVGTGDVVLFPSQTFHSVPKTETDKTRISLAFNSFWVGEIGKPNDDVNYLKLNVR